MPASNFGFSWRGKKNPRARESENGRKIEFMWVNIMKPVIFHPK